MHPVLWFFAGLWLALRLLGGGKTSNCNLRRQVMEIDVTEPATRKQAAKKTVPLGIHRGGIPTRGSHNLAGEDPPCAIHPIPCNSPTRAFSSACPTGLKVQKYKHTRYRTRSARTARKTTASQFKTESLITSKKSSESPISSTEILASLLTEK